MELNPIDLFRIIPGYINFFFDTLRDPRRSSMLSLDSERELNWWVEPLDYSRPEPIHPKLIAYTLISIVIGIALYSAMPSRPPIVDYIGPIVVTLVMWTVLTSALFLATRPKTDFSDFLTSVLAVLSVHYVIANFFALFVSIFAPVLWSHVFYFLWQVLVMPVFLIYALTQDVPSSKIIYVSYVLIHLIIVTYALFSLVYSVNTDKPFIGLTSIPSSTPTPTATFTPTFTPTSTLTVTPTPKKFSWLQFVQVMLDLLDVRT